jgi:hypothetical protein
MKRRKFLTIAGIGGVVAALASGKFLTTSFEDSISSLIKDELDFLKLDEQGLKDFSRDFSLTASRKFKLIVKGYSLLGITSKQSGKVHHLVSTFMLSSDFFINKMDESRVVKYVALFDPYVRPCVHPFSNLQHGDGTPPATSL